MFSHTLNNDCKKQSRTPCQPTKEVHGDSIRACEYTEKNVLQIFEIKKRTNYLQAISVYCWLYVLKNAVISVIKSTEHFVLFIAK